MGSCNAPDRAECNDLPGNAPWVSFRRTAEPTSSQAVGRRRKWRIGMLQTPTPAPTGLRRFESSAGHALGRGTARSWKNRRQRTRRRVALRVATHLGGRHRTTTAGAASESASATNVIVSVGPSCGNRPSTCSWVHALSKPSASARPRNARNARASNMPSAKR